MLKLTKICLHIFALLNFIGRVGRSGEIGAIFNYHQRKNRVLVTIELHIIKIQTVLIDGFDIQSVFGFLIKIL